MKNETERIFEDMDTITRNKLNGIKGLIQILKEEFPESKCGTEKLMELLGQIADVKF